MIEEKTDTEIFDECIRMLLKTRGFSCAKHNLERELVVTFARGNYDTPSTVVIEVNGSPIKGRAILSIEGSFDLTGREYRLRSHIPYSMVVDNDRGRLRRIRSDSPRIQSFVQLACFAYQLDKNRVVMRKVGDTLRFFKGCGDSLNHDYGDACDKSLEETQNLEGNET